MRTASLARIRRRGTPTTRVMAKHIPPTDNELHAIEALALDATPGPWEPQVVMDYQTGESTRVIVHAQDENEVQYVVEREHELAEADQAFIGTWPIRLRNFHH